MNALCLVVDRLHAGYLGAYGNAWIDTPSFDQLACEGFVFDQALAEASDPRVLYRALWQGRHPWVAADGPALPEVLARGGVFSALVTDAAWLEAHVEAMPFAERIVVDPPAAAIVDDVADSHVARVLAEVAAATERATRPFLVWAHLGLGECWDAPMEARRRFGDPEQGDPEPSDAVRPPALALSVDADPDAALAIAHAYAAQVARWDECLGGLLDALDAQGFTDDTLVVVLAPRGFPLGEHGAVGAAATALHSPLVHLPLALRLPDQRRSAGRSGAIVQLADVGATLAEWFLGPASVATTAGMGQSLLGVVRGDIDAFRDRAISVGDDEVAIRTPAWYLRANAAGRWLYVKPDDRWEVSDVADRCPQEVELLDAALADYREALAAGRAPAELPAVLIEGRE